MPRWLFIRRRGIFYEADQHLLGLFKPGINSVLLTTKLLCRRLLFYEHSHLR